MKLTMHQARRSRHNTQTQTMCRAHNLPSHRLLPCRRQMLVRAFYPGDLVDVLQRHAPDGRPAADGPASLIYARRFLEQVRRGWCSICEGECPVGLDRDGARGGELGLEVCCAGVAGVSIAWD